MKQVRFLLKTAYLTFVRLCRRQGLAVLLLVLCTALPLAIGPAAEQVLSQGAGFDGIHLAVTAPQGDPVPQALEALLPGMEDVSRYCRVTAMDYAPATEALVRGEVTAVLVLPEDFINGILTGANPDVTLIVPGDRPLETLLTLWVGQSATDLLSAFQSAIYTVLEAWERSPAPGLSYEQAVAQINLKCIRWTLERRELFTVQNVPVTGALPIGLHYSISILLFLLLAGGAVFTPVYEGERTRQTRRFLAAGQSPRTAYAGTLMGCCLLSLCLLLPAALLLSQGAILSTLLRCLPAALFIAVFGSLCCLITAQAQQGGLLACLLALGMLGASGGILPGVMLPETLRKLLPFSPVTWMRLLLTASDGWAGSLAALVACSAVLAVLGGLLYRRRFWKEVRAL